MIKTNDRVKNLRSPIRDILKVANVLEVEHKELFYMNSGDPNKFDFDTPEYLKQELINVAKGKTGNYSRSEGDVELVEAIIKREAKKNLVKLSKDDITVTQGTSEGISFLFGAGLDAGDEVLLAGPGYPSYIQLAKFFGGVTTSYRCDEENGWQPDVDDIRKKITDKTKFLFILNPNNPTGAVYSRSTLKQIVDVAAEHKIALVSDEIYDQLIFGDTEHYGLASLAKDTSVVVFNGFSKGYLMPGWRVGYVYFHDPADILGDLKDGINNQARQRISANTLVQKVCAKAFDGPQDHIKEMNKKLKERAEFAYKRLNEINRISAVKPEGAFYIFPKVDMGNRWKNDEEFTIDVLRNTGVIFPYGSGFDAVYGKGHFRSIILPPIELMNRAFQKLDNFMKRT